MPNLANARKSLRQAKKRAAQNLLRKDKVKETVKLTQKAKSYEEAVKLARDAQKALDKAAKVGTIDRNTAARKFSRLMKKVNKLKK